MFCLHNFVEEDFTRHVLTSVLHVLLILPKYFSHMCLNFVQLLQSISNILRGYLFCNF